MATNLERWRGRVAVVTGASSGIGEAAARRLAEAGLRVVLAGRRQERLEALAGEIRAAGGEALPVPVDLREQADIARLFATVRETWGGTDVLINNAGLGLDSTVVAGDPADWRQMLDVNVLALSVCAQEALRDMADKPEGQIVNVSSLAGHRVPLGRNVTYYSASKHAVKAITDGLRDELCQRGSPVRVGMVSPGVVETEFLEVFHGDKEQGRSRYTGFKVLEADDVADAVLYMLSVPPHAHVHDIVLRPLAQPH